MSIHPTVMALPEVTLDEYLQILASSPHAMCATSLADLPEKTKRSIINQLFHSKDPEVSLRDALHTAAIIIMPSLVAAYSRKVEEGITDIESLFWIHGKSEQLEQETKFTISALKKMLEIFEKLDEDMLTSHTEPLNYAYLESNTKNFCHMANALQNTLKLRGFARTCTAIMMDLGSHVPKKDYAESVAALREMGATDEQVKAATELAHEYFMH